MASVTKRVTTSPPAASTCRGTRTVCVPSVMESPDGSPVEKSLMAVSSGVSWLMLPAAVGDEGGRGEQRVAPHVEWRVLGERGRGEEAHAIPETERVFVRVAVEL